MTDPVDVQEIMRDIRARVRNLPVPPSPEPSSTSAIPAAPDWGRLEEAGMALEQTYCQVGQLPPEPPTLRGSAGAFLVKLVHRALFWYTPPLLGFHEAGVRAFKELFTAVRTVATAGQQSRAELDILNRQVAGLRVETERLEKLLRAQREQLPSIVEKQLLPEVQARRVVESRLEAATRKLEDLAQAVPAETVPREFTQYVDGEVEAHAALKLALAAATEGREDLAGRVDGEAAAGETVARAPGAEKGARGALAGRVDTDLRQSNRRLLQLCAEAIGQSRRVSLHLEEARKRFPAPCDEKQLVPIAEEQKHALDAIYVSLEDLLRGTAEIKDRARVYLPLLQERQLGTKRMPILDLGCGKGEWLELLRDNKLEARGIDINRVLVWYCREAGLDVAEEDILEHLKNQPDRSLGAVTGLHIIEHLPFDTVVRVFGETVRVLKPGGIAIFETSNPQNVPVASRHFYPDFTHRNPLPPETAQFVLEARGLCDVRILNLHPHAESLQVHDDRTEPAKRVNECFRGSQEYAVIGRKE